MFAFLSLIIVVEKWLSSSINNPNETGIPYEVSSKVKNLCSW